MLAPVTRERAVVLVRQVMVFEPGFARARRVETAEDVEQGGLAAARRAEQHDHFAGPQFEVHAAQRVHFDFARAVDLAEVARAEHCPLRTRGRHDREDLAGEQKSAEKLARCRPWQQ